MELVYYPDPRLTRRAVEIDAIDDEVRDLARGMTELMHEKKGIGLAANQVGELRRVIVVNPTTERGSEMVLLNPVVVSASGRITGEEGCLSVPGVYAEIERCARVQVRALDLEGRPLEIEGSGLLAVVLQHEIDHLDGILFLMRMTPADRTRHRRRLVELEGRFRASADA